MHEALRNGIKENLGDGGYNVTFASETSPQGTLLLSSDPYQGVADMFSMASSCVNLLPSSLKSTYLLTSVNLMNETRVFPGDRWREDKCLGGHEFPDTRPTGDFWNKKDLCGLHDITCAARTDGNQSRVANATGREMATKEDEKSS